MKKHKNNKEPLWVSHFFSKQWQYDIEQKQIVQRLINHSNEMASVYAEIDKGLPSHEFNFYERIIAKLEQIDTITESEVQNAVAHSIDEVEELLESYKVVHKMESYCTLTDIYGSILNELHSQEKPSRSIILKIIRDKCYGVEVNSDKTIARDAVLAAIVDGAVLCSPQKIQIKEGVNSIGSPFYLSAPEVKQNLKDIENLREDIDKTIKKLNGLIYQYEEKTASEHFESKACLDPLELVFLSGDRYEPCPKWTFYPHISKFLARLAKEFGKPVDYRQKPINFKKIFSSQKTSSREFICYLLNRMDDEIKNNHLPQDFHLSNQAIADITACALELPDSCKENNIADTKKRLLG